LSCFLNIVPSPNNTASRKATRLGCRGQEFTLW